MRTFSDILRVVAMVLLGYLAFGVQSSNAQVQLPPYYKPQFLDQNGRPLSNGCVFTYASGTNTPQATYTDFTGSTPNPNPILLDGSGRPPLGTDIWLSSGSYRFKLVTQGGTNCSTGVQQWIEDGITSSTGTILAANNTWTGTNTFNGPTIFNASVTMNAGFTSNGPSNLTAGGSLTGNFTGSPVFQGTPFFNNAFQVNGDPVFNGQIDSTLTTGVSPFIINSQTEVTNLNANFLQGGTWATPLAIGSTTPMNGTFTGLHATTNFQIGSSALIGSIQGTDPTLLSSGTVSGAAGTQLCLDANGGATTVGCTGGGFSRISTGTNGAVCTTGSSAGATCSTVVGITPTQADTSYIPSCMGISITGAPYIVGSTSLTTTTIAVTISNGQGSQAVPSTYGSLACTAVHP